MNRLVAAEWHKLRTTRSSKAVIGGLLAMVALIAWGSMADVGVAGGMPASDAREALATAPGFITGMVLVLLGAVGAAGEFQHRTATATYLITPRRGRVLAAKLIAYFGLGTVVAAAAVAIALPISLAAASGNDVHVATGSELAELAAILIACGGLAGASGVAVGSMVRSQTSVVLALVAWILFAERVLPLPLLPFTSLLTAAGMSSDDAPPALVGLAALGGWTAVLAGTARRWTITKDVT